MMNDCMTKFVLVANGFEIVNKYIDNQNKFNRNVAIFSLLVTAYALMQHVKIKKLGDEVKELKQAMEE